LLNPPKIVILGTQALVLEAIVLAQEIAVDYVVLDNLLARRKAQRLGA